MRYHRLGHSDLEVSEVCLGTMTFGEQNTEAEGHAQLDEAFELGINFVDTAEMYSVPARAETQGNSEKILGSWLARQRRDRVILASKVAGHSGFDWIRNGAQLTRSQIREAVEGSLQRLQTDYIDLYQVHWPDRYVPKFGILNFEARDYYAGAEIAETIAALDELVGEGKIRYYGLSNETPWGTCQYLKLAEREGYARPVSIQNAYSLLNRVYDIHMAEISYHENIPLLAYSVLAFGLLTGKYRNGAMPEGSRFALFPNYPSRYKNKVNSVEAVEAYAELAGERGLTSLALQFAASRPHCKSVIIGATNLAQLRENIAAFAESLDEETLQRIDEIHQRFPNPCP